MADTTRVAIRKDAHKEIKTLAAQEETYILDLVDEMTDLYKYARQSGYLSEFRSMIEKCKKKNNL